MELVKRRKLSHDARMKRIGLLLFALAMFADSGSVAETWRVTPRHFRGAKQPQVAVGENGNVYVAFGKDDDIYASVSADGGRTFRDPVRVGRVDKLALGMRRGPRIATTRAGVTLTAISHEDGNVYSWSSTDAGHSWGEPLVVNTMPNSAREGLHALASDGKARLLTVWLDLRSGKTELWSSVSGDGGKTWGANVNVYKSPDLTICECCHPSVIFTETDKVVVMWRNWLNGARDMYRSISSDGGLTFSAAEKIGTGTWKLNACPMDGGSLAASDETVSYAWRRGGKLFFTTHPGSEQLLAESGTHPVVMRSNHDFAYVWQDQGNLFWTTSALKEMNLLASNAGFAASTWSVSQKKSILVWEEKDGVFVTTFPQR